MAAATATAASASRPACEVDLRAHDVDEDVRLEVVGEHGRPPRARRSRPPRRTGPGRSAPGPARRPSSAAGSARPARRAARSRDAGRARRRPGRRPGARPHSSRAPWTPPARCRRRRPGPTRPRVYSCLASANSPRMASSWARAHSTSPSVRRSPAACAPISRQRSMPSGDGRRAVHGRDRVGAGVAALEPGVAARHGRRRWRARRPRRPRRSAARSRAPCR